MHNEIKFKMYAANRNFYTMKEMLSSKPYRAERKRGYTPHICVPLQRMHVKLGQAQKETKKTRKFREKSFEKNIWANV